MSIPYFIAMAITLIGAELGYFWIARKYNILDKPNIRSMHQKPTIRGGGVIFYLSVALFFVVTFSLSPYFFIAITLVSAIGMLDDVKSQSTLLRFVVQSAAFFILFYGMDVYTLPVWVVLIIFIICTGTLNAYNFMDGINGITGGYSMVILVGLYVTNALIIPFTDQDFLIIVMIGLMIFNYFNFRTKAVCFAGDVGSTTIGFIIIFLILQLILKTHNYVFIGMLAVYAADSLLTICHRIWMRENISKPHRHHFFQVVVFKTGISHLTMTIIFMLAQALITTIIIMNAKRSMFDQYKSFFLIAVVLTTIYIVVKKKLIPTSFTLKERNTL